MPGHGSVFDHPVAAGQTGGGDSGQTPGQFARESPAAANSAGMECHGHGTLALVRGHLIRETLDQP